MEYLGYNYTFDVTSGTSNTITSFAWGSIAVLYETPKFVGIDPATPEKPDKCELNKLKKKERENLNPRSRKNSRGC